jgi:hypothetical protein
VESNFHLYGELYARIQRENDIFEQNVDPPDRHISGYIRIRERAIKDYRKKYPELPLDEETLRLHRI